MTKRNILLISRNQRLFGSLIVVMAVVFFAAGSRAQAGQDVTLTIRAGKDIKGQRGRAAENTVVWLNPIDQPMPEPRSLPQVALVQKNKQFMPHMLVVPTGTMVDFPNLDPFFHNVFSMFNGKRFDLGLYESGSHRSVRFDREGVSFIFCNIHPEMGAVVIALRTPYYAVSDADGRVVIRNVPKGRYRMSLWSERFQAEASLETQVVAVESSAVDLGPVQVTPKADPLQNHRNKFGEEYPRTTKPPY